MKKRIIIKENGKIKQIITFEPRDEAHFQAQLKNPHKIVENKKTYNRKKVKKVLDI
jgi:hypothetical protein